MIRPASAFIPWIVDTTLRDGEQAAGVAFPLPTRIEVARRVVALGVQELEIGTPAMGEEEVAALRKLVALKLPCRMTCWCRLRLEDLEAANRTGADAVHLSFPASALHQRILHLHPEETIERLDALVRAARRAFSTVSVGAQDASRAELPYLLRALGIAEAAGADRFRLADTVGVLDPLATARLVRRFVRGSGIAIGFHGHNDFGMATANAIAALMAGAEAVDVTVSGLGERAGNARLEEVLAWLRLRGIGQWKTESLPDLARFVAAAARRRLEDDRPIVGAAAFRHESGIHVAGILQDPRAYEALPPEMVGREGRVFVFGRHSGVRSLRHALGKDAPNGEAEEMALLSLVRRQADRLGRGLSRDEVLALCRKQKEA